VRKRVEEIFGWMKTVGGLRKTGYRGLDRTQLHAYWVAAAYNLLRIARLSPAPHEARLHHTAALVAARDNRQARRLARSLSPP
jgi:Transposase DDE domain